MMTDAAPADAALAYIKYVMAELRLSASALANLAGISSSTLTRPINNASYKFAPSLITLSKIAKVSGIDPAPFLSAKNFVSANLVPYTEKILDESWGEGANFEPGELDSVIMIGDCAAGEWREFEIAPFRYSLMLQATSVPAENCFSLGVKGTSTDLIAREGQMFFCVRTEALGKKDPHHNPTAAMFHPFGRNSALVIERRSPDRRLVEISVRFPVWTGAEWHFVCPSSDPIHRKPLERATLESDEHFIILGQATWVVGHAHLDDALMHKMGLT